MAVGVRGGAHLRVSEELHDDPRMDALGQQERRGGVPAVVQPDVADARLVQGSLPGVAVRLPLDRLPVGLRENQVVVLPRRAGRDPLLELCGAVGAQRLDELAGQRQGPPAAVGPGLLVEEAMLGDTVRLEELEAAGLVERTVMPTTPVAVRYRSTPQGIDLITALQPIAGYVQRWERDPEQAPPTA